MPKRTDIKKILIIGSGPIVIGQACEFDYSGAQACKALRAEGYRVVLVNSNPATIMTDPELADRTYIEPLTTEYLEEIIARERPRGDVADGRWADALNLAVELAESGHPREVQRRNDRRVARGDQNRRRSAVVQGRDAGKSASKCRRRQLVNNAQEALRLCDSMGFPLVIRPSFTLGGTGGGIAYNREEFGEAIPHAARMSPGA